MTKPNDFRYNSDYMSMGQTSSVDTFNVSVSQGSYQRSGSYIQPIVDNLDFDIPATDGAVEEYLIEFRNVKYSNKVLYISRTASTGVNSGTVIVVVWRLNASKIRVTIVRQHRFGTFTTLDPAPAVSLGIRVTTFKPPNLT